MDRPLLPYTLAIICTPCFHTEITDFSKMWIPSHHITSNLKFCSAFPLSTGWSFKLLVCPTGSPQWNSNCLVKQLVYAPYPAVQNHVSVFEEVHTLFQSTPQLCFHLGASVHHLRSTSDVMLPWWLSIHSELNFPFIFFHDMVYAQSECIFNTFN